MGISGFFFFDAHLSPFGELVEMGWEKFETPGNQTCLFAPICGLGGASFQPCHYLYCKQKAS